jgi:hypothetical protein
MLTQIEWWGGIIFVLGAVTYRLVMGALEKGQGYDWYRWLMRLFFVLPGLVLAGYFYPLERQPLQYAYLALLGVSLLLVLGMMFNEITSDGPDGEEAPGEDKAAKARGEGEKEKEEEGGEPGWLLAIVGAAVLYSPVLVACGLGCYKAWPMAQRLVG